MHFRIIQKVFVADVVAKIFYPKYDAANYNAFATNGGYGGLFSLVLRTEEEAARFYDALNVAKGPSLGTNFTLASPYAILAHYGELDWAKGFGVDRWLIRVSIGLEEPEELIELFTCALNH
jgi:cystathionine gamma-synthase